MHLIRLQFIFFEIIISKKNIRLTFKFDISGQKVNLSNYIKEYDFILKIIGRRYSKIHLNMDLKSLSRNIPLTFDLSTLKNPPPLPEEDILDYVKITSKLLSKLNVDEKFYLDTISRHQFPLSMFNLAEFGIDGDIGINITLEKPVPKELLDGRSVSVILPIAMPIDESKFIVFFYSIKDGISLVEENNNILLNIEVRKIHKYHYELIESPLTESKFRELAEEWININEEKDAISFIPNWN